jgi:hypothetical protein
MRRAMRDRGFSAEEFVELAPRPGEVLPVAVAPLYADCALDTPPAAGPSARRGERVGGHRQVRQEQLEVEA